MAMMRPHYVSILVSIRPPLTGCACQSGDLIVQEQHLHTKRRVSCPHLQLARAITLQQALYTLVGDQIRLGATTTDRSEMLKNWLNAKKCCDLSLFEVNSGLIFVTRPDTNERSRHCNALTALSVLADTTAVITTDWLLWVCWAVCKIIKTTLHSPFAVGNKTSEMLLCFRNFWVQV